MSELTDKEIDEAIQGLAGIIQVSPVWGAPANFGIGVITALRNRVAELEANERNLYDAMWDAVWQVSLNNGTQDRYVEHLLEKCGAHVPAPGRCVECQHMTDPAYTDAVGACTVTGKPSSRSNQVLGSDVRCPWKPPKFQPRAATEGDEDASGT